MATIDDNNRERSFDEAVRQFVEAQLSGYEPDIEDFVRQYPEFEHQFRQKIKEFQKVDSLFDTLVQADENDFADAVTEPSLVGQKIGNFEIAEMIGRGGMGVVYLARDTKLKRSVAIKSIPAALAADSTARARFRREAELLASLNHPNIAVIHEIIEEKKSGYLVLEYVSGQTLAERITKGPLKLQEALTIALQIAEAVAAAHEHDVIHRDLKPGNIKITPEGEVKVLDFGLAKTVGGEPSEKPTTVTQPGRLMGTPAYMSPEQARGKPTDKRSDIWSFGCVLYEMLIGKVPFEGETVSDTIANILQTEPNWQALPQSTPANICVLLRRCLEKDTRQRLQHVGDAVIEIRETLSPPSTAPPTISLTGLEAAPRPKSRTVAIIVVAALICILVGTVALWGPWRASSLPKSQLSRFVIDLAQGETIGGTAYEPAAVGSKLTLSPDGTRVVYVIHHGDTSHLCLHSFKKFKGEIIPGTEDAQAPFFSPDGSWIGFFADGKLKKVSLLGGAPQPICEAQRTRGGCWLEDDTIVFADEQKYGLWQVPASVGEPRRLTTPLRFLREEQEHSHLFPHILPEGKGVLFTITRAGYSSIATFSFETDRYKTLIERGSCAHYVHTGHLIYYLAGDLYAVPFDLKDLNVTGPSVPVVGGVMSFYPYNECAQFSVSRNGSLVYVPGSAARWTNHRIVRVDRTGKVEALPFPLGAYQSPRIAPDGDRLLVVESKPETTPQLWVFDLARGAKRRLTDDRGDTYWGIWTPDGKQIVFNSSLGGETMDLYSRPADGSAPERPIVQTNKLHIVPMSWADDGKTLIITTVTVDPNTDFDIKMLPYEAASKPQPLVNTHYNEFHPAISPSGRWLAYASDESGRAEIYIKPYPGPGGTILVTTDGGREPVWDPSEKELYFRDDTGDKVFKVSILTEPTVQIGSPELLFEGRYLGSSSFWGRVYDISPKGDFFVLIEEGEIQPATQINVVLNWFEELKRLVPSQKE